MAVNSSVKGEDEEEELGEAQNENHADTNRLAQPRSCPYCLTAGAEQTRGQHPLFVYMVTINDEGLSKGVINCTPQLGMSSNPLVRANELNRKEGFRPGSKNSLSGAPYWQVELVIGPFHRDGGKFKQDWLAKSRTPLRRFVYGILLAQNWNSAFGTGLVVYARNKDNTIKVMREDAWGIDQA